MEDEVFEVRDLRDKHFFMVDDEYLNGYAKLCGAIASCVYFSLCRHADKKQTCFPSKKLMAEEFDVSERSVYDAIEKLKYWGLIGVDQARKKDGSFQNNTYLLYNKKVWRSKPSNHVANSNIDEPQANIADGSPQANDDINRRQPLPNKETHSKETHIYTKNKKEELEDSGDLTYVPSDEDGNPIKTKKKSGGSSDKPLLIAIGSLWRKMAAYNLDISEQEVLVTNITRSLGYCITREKFNYDDFQRLFTYFFNSNLSQDKKISFDLCLSEKYVASYKIAQRSKPKTQASFSSELPL